MTKREESIRKSIDDLSTLIRKGASSIFYYLDLGVPKFDVLLSNDGTIINNSKKKVSYGKSTPGELMEKLYSLMDDLKAKEASQASLF